MAMNHLHLFLDLLLLFRRCITTSFVSFVINLLGTSGNGIAGPVLHRSTSSAMSGGSVVRTRAAAAHATSNTFNTPTSTFTLSFTAVSTSQHGHAARIDDSSTNRSHPRSNHTANNRAETLRIRCPLCRTDFRQFRQRALMTIEASHGMICNLCTERMRPGTMVNTCATHLYFCGAVWHPACYDWFSPQTPEGCPGCGNNLFQACQRRSHRTHTR